MALRQADHHRAVLGFLSEAGNVDGPEPFPPELLEMLRGLVPCRSITYYAYNAEADTLLFDACSADAIGEDVGPANPDYNQLLWEHRAENPLCAPHPRRAVKLSDYLSRRQLLNYGFYVECYRPEGVEYLLELTLRRDSRIRDGFTLERGDRDFRERDRDVLELLEPFLVQLRRNADVRRRLAAVEQTPAPAAALTPREREILQLVAEGLANVQIARALFISSGTVRKHLENAYEKLDVTNRTAAAARAFGMAGRNGTGGPEAAA